MKFTWKKMFSLSLAAVMALSLAACGSSSEETTAAETQAEETTAAAETEAAEDASGEAEETAAATGEGIAPEDLPHIFKRFYRSRHSSSSGFGLGLPLARSIIEDQGGMIFVESAPSRGSVFTISFLTDL